MPIEINNTNYQKVLDGFRTFADRELRGNGRKGDAVARLSGRSLAVYSGLDDKNGAWYRSAASKDANTLVRDVFCQAIKIKLGVPDDAALKRLVGEDLKWDDFGSQGRPLTARRISAILNKIDSVLDEAPNRLKLDDAQKVVELTMNMAPAQRPTERAATAYHQASQLIFSGVQDRELREAFAFVDKTFQRIAGGNGSMKTSDVVKSLAEMLKRLDEMSVTSLLNQRRTRAPMVMARILTPLVLDIIDRMGNAEDGVSYGSKVDAKFKDIRSELGIDDRMSAEEEEAYGDNLEAPSEEEVKADIDAKVSGLWKFNRHRLEDVVGAKSTKSLREDVQHAEDRQPEPPQQPTVDDGSGFGTFVATPFAKLIGALTGRSETRYNEIVGQQGEAPEIDIEA